MERKPFLLHIQYAVLSFLLIFSTLVFAQSPGKRNYSLTISGGISLGVYEAGLNWVILELLRKRSLEASAEYNLRAVTGASAGAINTLIAALRYCELDSSRSGVENNFFAEAWRDIDVSRMLPKDVKQYDKLQGYHDGIISRTVFSGIISQLEAKAKSNQFRNGCHLNLGLTVTRSIPEVTSIGSGDAKQSLKIQRFVIPIRLQVKEHQVVFSNDLDYARRNGELGYLFLRQDAQGRVDFKNVIRAALASSAFPLAFGRVRLQYCRPKQQQNGSDDCPAGYEPREYDFVDGGVFDNIPLGLAVELAECSPATDQQCTPISGIMNYIYMDPANRRNSIAKGKADEENDNHLNPGYGIYNQGKFWIKAQDVYANAELYRTLASKFREKDLNKRRLLLTNRYGPLGGSYLAHFGAFFDKSFRDFDYYVGVYDGIINSARHLLVEPDRQTTQQVSPDCFRRTISDQKAHHCLGTVAGMLTHELLNDSDETALRFVRMLAEHEYDTENNAWQWVRKLPAYNKTFEFELFQALRDEQELDFEKLLERLKKIQGQEQYANVFGEQLRNMLNDADTWKIDIGRKIFSRLEFLERNDKDHHEALVPLKLANMAVNSYEPEENNKLWAISSFTPTKWYHYLIPDEVAFDSRQSNLMVTYRDVIYRMQGSRSYWEWQLTPIHWKRKRDVKSDNYFSAGINLRTARTSALYSSYGVGLRVYKNNNDNPLLDNNYMYGIATNFGFFADKFRIGVEYRQVAEGKQDDHLLLLFGLGDIKGFGNVLFGD